ncbi:MAG: SusD/RagB family nutrient-binding outer membrane lipoprotein [Bacteroidales bacterium]
MKKIIFILLVFVVASSCRKLEDLNVNTKDPVAVSGESLFTGAQKNLFDQMVSTNVNMNIFRLFVQYWTECTYIDESNYDLTTRTIPDNHWNVLYRDVLKDFQESAKIVGETEYGMDGDDGQGKKNRLAIIELMNVYTWSVLVETFGDVPYSEALNLEKPLPKYDDAEGIYRDLITRIDAALGNMDADYVSFGIADNMYQGDVASWIKFAKSLKLKLGIIMADVDNGYAKGVVEAAAGGAFSSNADNGALPYLSAVPNTNPLYEDLVASGRKDFVVANTIVDVMNTLNDPRRAYYMTMHEGAYVGGEYGASNDFTAFSHIADAIQEPTFEGMILDYAEVCFYLAEAVERGYAVGGTAAAHYEAGIRASIDYWGGTTAEADAYLAQATVAYATAAGDWKQKIGMQSWIGFYNRGFEAWTQFRRLDYPQLVAPPDAQSVLPLRYTYPIAEQTLNGANYDAASAAIGGDDVGTKLFFDKN